MERIIKPPKLHPGDLVGILSPAGPVEEAELEYGRYLLERSGFRVHLCEHVFDRRRYLAGEDRDRLADLNGMLLNPDIKAVFCARGGYGTLRILDRIRYDLLTSNPKILLGFSDITALLMAVFSRTGLITFHGPVLRALPKGEMENWDRIYRVLTADKPLRVALENGKTLVKGRSRGRLVGGNLSLICHLTGTPFMPPLENGILFLEDTNEPIYRIDRMLTHLKLSGCLKGLTGLLFGEFTRCGNPFERERLFLETAAALNIPSATGFPVGHGRKNWTIPLGLMATLDTETGTLSLPEAGVA